MALRTVTYQPSDLADFASFNTRKALFAEDAAQVATTSIERTRHSAHAEAYRAVAATLSSLLAGARPTEAI